MANIDEETSRSHKNPDMVLVLDSKSENFLSDQTPTPIRLIQKCEEIGIFKDFQNVNPFEETFRKAAEDIRSGSIPLEMSSLSIPNNADDSLHTPHVIFPLPNDLNRRKAISPRDDLSISGTDSLCLSLDNDEADKMVVQQEADTSEETQMPNLIATGSNGSEDSSFGGTIQFLLRMPNGKMVQLSSHPVEQLDNTPQNGLKEKDIPLIKVDSSFLKAVGTSAKEDSPTLSIGSAVSIMGSSASGTGVSHFVTGVSHYETPLDDTSSKISGINSNQTKHNSIRISQETDQISKMSLAKQKLKQALMNNTCPATSSVTSSFVPPPLIPHSDSGPQSLESRRPSSPSDDGASQDNVPTFDSGSIMDEKRKRNRAAAMRCREKRKTWVKDLERRANDMMRTNGQLQHEVSMLRDEVAQLKTLLLAHRDCPVTQALIEGKATLPLGIPGTYLTSSLSEMPSQNSKRSPSKEQKYSPSPVVFQTPGSGNAVKPRILLSDPPVKRKRLNSSTTVGSPTAVSVVTSPPVSSTVHTVVLPSKSSNFLNPSYVNVIPSVVVANPTNPSGSTLGQQVIYPQLLSCLPAIAPKPNLNVVTSQQTYILPKGKTNIKPKAAPNILAKPPVMKQIKPETKFRSTHLLSTNVIKINPNVVDRDTNDSDIEILDVK